MSRWKSIGRRPKIASLDARLSNPDRKSITTRKLREPIDARIKSSRTIAAEPIEAAEVAIILQRIVNLPSDGPIGYAISTNGGCL